jgi:hypothetical protein
MMARTGLPYEYLEAFDVERFAELARVLGGGDAPSSGNALDERARYLAEVRRGSRVEDLPAELADPDGA